MDKPIDDWSVTTSPDERADAFVEASRPYYVRVRPVLAGIEYFGLVKVDPLRRHASLGPLRTRAGAIAIVGPDQVEAIVTGAFRWA